MSGSQRNIQTVIRNLQRRNARRRRGEVVLEGIRLLEEALAASAPLARVAVSPALERTERGRRLLDTIRARDIPVDPVTDDELQALSDTETPQGVIAVAGPVAWSLDQVATRPGAVVLLDAVQDPGNVGTIVRTAHALGAAGVVLLPGCAGLSHPKVLRAAMGSTFRFPVLQAGTEAVRPWLGEHGIEVWVAAGDGEPVGPREPRGRVALVIGNEGAGVGDVWRNTAARTVTIPLADGVDSLNAAAAAAILLYEVGRDR